MDMLTCLMRRTAIFAGLASLFATMPMIPKVSAEQAAPASITNTDPAATEAYWTPERWNTLSRCVRTRLLAGDPVGVRGSADTALRGRADAPDSQSAQWTKSAPAGRLAEKGLRFSF